MAFVLPAADADDAAGGPPAPRDGSDVQLERVPARLVATQRFGGVATDAEVARQRAALVEALARDGGYAPLDEDEFSVLQASSRSASFHSPLLSGVLAF